MWRISTINEIVSYNIIIKANVRVNKFRNIFCLWEYYFKTKYFITKCQINVTLDDFLKIAQVFLELCLRIMLRVKTIRG